MKNPDVMSGFFRFIYSAFLKTLVDGIFAPKKKFQKNLLFFLLFVENDYFCKKLSTYSLKECQKFRFLRLFVTK